MIGHGRVLAFIGQALHFAVHRCIKHSVAPARHSFLRAGIVLSGLLVEFVCGREVDVCFFELTENAGLLLEKDGELVPEQEVVSVIMRESFGFFLCFFEESVNSEVKVAKENSHIVVVKLVFLF